MRSLIENLEFALLVDPGDTVLREASVVVENDRILDIGPAGDVTKRHKGDRFDRVIDGRMLFRRPGPAPPELCEAHQGRQAHLLRRRRRPHAALLS